ANTPMTRTAYSGKKYGARAMKKLVLEMTTWPPCAETFIFRTWPPKNHVHRTCVNSWPKTYTHIGFGSSRKITVQQAAPARNGTHARSAPPQVRTTFHKAMPAPPQTGSSSMAMKNLIHFGTR